MSRGYITIAQNSGDLDYVRMAYALAASIKKTQSEVDEFAIIVDPNYEMPEEYKWAFDYIIPMDGWMEGGGQRTVGGGREAAARPRASCQSAYYL